MHWTAENKGECAVLRRRPVEFASMAKAARETRFDLQRNRVLKAAATCFNAKGFSGTSLKDVSRHLGLTDAALYYYVKNKEELVYLCYLRAAELGWDAMQQGLREGDTGYQKAFLYLSYHIAIMVGDRGPVAIMSEIPSLSRVHRNEILELSRRHSAAFESLLEAGIEDGSIVQCDVRMTGNAIMGSVNWIPKWYHGKQKMAREIQEKFPHILMQGLNNATTAI